MEDQFLEAEDSLHLEDEDLGHQVQIVLPPPHSRAEGRQRASARAQQQQKDQGTRVQVTALPSLSRVRPTVAQPKLASSPQFLRPIIPSIVDKINLRKQEWGNTPLCERLRGSLPFWQKHASSEVLQIIREGFKPPWTQPPQDVDPRSPPGRSKFGAGPGHFAGLPVLGLGKTGGEHRLLSRHSLVFGLKTRGGGGE